VVNLDLVADRIELAQFMTESSQRNPSATAGAEPKDADSPLAALRGFDGELNLQAGALVIPGTPEVTNLKLSASLDSGRLLLAPLNFNIAGGSWSSSVALEVASTPASGIIEAEFENIVLRLLGDTFTPLEDRLGKLSGKVHLGMTESLAADQKEELTLPYIGRLYFEPSKLAFTDPEAGTDMTLRLRTKGLDNPDANEQTFLIDGEGVYDGSPFSLRFRGDPLLAARDPDRPYALDLKGPQPKPSEPPAGHTAAQSAPLHPIRRPVLPG